MTCHRFLRPIRRGETFWATPTVLALSRVPYERDRIARKERVERPGEGYSLFQVTKMNEGFFGTEFSIPGIFS